MKMETQNKEYDWKSRAILAVGMFAPIAGIVIFLLMWPLGNSHNSIFSESFSIASSRFMFFWFLSLFVVIVHNTFWKKEPFKPIFYKSLPYIIAWVFLYAIAALLYFAYGGGGDAPNLSDENDLFMLGVLFLLGVVLFIYVGTFIIAFFSRVSYKKWLVCLGISLSLSIICIPVMLNL